MSGGASLKHAGHSIHYVDQLSHPFIFTHICLHTSRQSQNAHTNVGEQTRYIIFKKTFYVKDGWFSNSMHFP